MIAFMVVVILLTNPSTPTRSSSMTPTVSASGVPTARVTAEELVELANDLRSGNRDALVRVLALPADEVTTEVSSGFASLDMVWDVAAAQPIEDVDGLVIGWNIPADVTEPDRSITSWIVTVASGDDGLVFIDSVEVPK